MVESNEKTEVEKVEEGRNESEEIIRCDENTIVDFSTAPKEDLIDSNKIMRYLYNFKNPAVLTISYCTAQNRANELGVGVEFAKLWQDYCWERYNVPNGIIRDIDLGGLKLRASEYNFDKYHLDESGVWYNKQKGSTFVQVPVTRKPIFPLYKKKRIPDGVEKYVVAYKRANDWDVEVFDREVIINQRKITDSGKKGFPVTTSNAKEIVDFIDTITMLNEDKFPIRYTIDRLGWYKNECVPYTGNIEVDDSVKRELLEAMQAQKGTAQEWLDYMVPLMKKSVKFRLSVATTAASLVMHKLKSQPYFFYLWGKTGVGKSVALRAAMSIWGDPEDGKLVVPINSTDGAAMKRAGALHSFTYGADESETEKLEPQVIQKKMMLLSEGVERGRLTKDSAMESPLVWRNNFFFTGEAELVHSNSGGGFMNRVLEVEVDVGEMLFEKPREVALFALSHYGTVGRIFVQKLKEYSQKQLEVDYRLMLDLISQDKRITGKQANAAALVLLGGYLFYKFILPGESFATPDVISVLQKSCKKEEQVDVGIRAQEYIIDCLYENIKSFANGSNDAMPINSMCFGKIQGDVFFVSKTKVEEWLERKGFSYRAVTRTWKGNGFLMVNSQERYTTETTVNGRKMKLMMLKPSAVLDQEAKSDM